MADLSVDGDTIVLRLSALEKVEALHGDLRAPLGAVRDLLVVGDPPESVAHWGVGF